MCVRKLALVVGLISVLGVEFASALGLGEIKLNSTLNQPLNAEIKLLQARSLAEEEILVRLASKEDFERAGVERVFFLSDIKFEVVLDNSSGPIVRLTSSKPVREPFLNFLLETQWPSGRLLREYTLLMDLPVFSSEAVRPIQGAQTQPSRQTSVKPAPEPVRERPQPVSPERPPVQAADRGAEPQRRADVYGPITENDTLWEIALNVRPDRTTSVQQTMLALQRLNPGAFINDNINLLRKGQVLRIPTRDEIYELSEQQAISQVAQQNSQWSRDTEATGAQLEGSNRVASGRQTQAPGQGRVSLAAPGEAENSASGKGSGAVQGDVEALENELAIAMEELDKSRRENAELTSRINDLEEQISTMERLVEVSNQELRALQLASQKSEQVTAAAETSVPEQEATTAEQETSAERPEDPEQQTAAAGPEDPEQQAAAERPEDPEQQATAERPEDPEQQAAVETAREPAAEEAPPADPARTVVRSRKQEKSLLDILFDNIAWVGGGLLAVIGGGILFMRRRAQMATEEELDELDALPENDFFEDSDIDMDERAEASAEESQLANEDIGFDSTLEEESDIGGEEAATVEPETGDVVGETDIYIAYGKFDQAEDMLRKALQDEPSRTDVHLKLLEVYAESKNLQKFDQQYAQLLSYNDGDANQRAQELRLHFSDAGEFNASAATSAQEEAAHAFESEPLDTHVTLGEPEAASDDDSAMSLDDMDDLSLDLDLDLDLDEKEKTTGVEPEDLDLELDLEEAPTPATSGQEQEDAFDFDFELDLDEEEQPTAAAQVPASLAGELDLEPEETAAGGVDPVAAQLDSGASDEGFELDLSSLDEEDDREKVASNLDLSGQNLGLDSSDTDRGSTETAEAAQDDFSLQGQEFELDLDMSGDALVSEPGDADGLDFEDDDFDLDMGDVDMAALDQEVESLGADFDFGEDEEFDLALDKASEKPVLREPITDFDLAVGEEPANETSPAAEANGLDEDLFAQALSGLPEMESGSIGGIGDEGALFDEDTELDFLADTDEAATKLDLARAYIDMGDKEGAKDILDEVTQEGDDRQRQEAQELLTKIG